MGRRPLLALVLVVAVLAVPSCGAAAVAAAGSAGGSSPAVAAAGENSAPGRATAAANPAVQDGSFERSVVRIRVTAEGDGVWTFRYERPLETDDEREAFESFAAEFRENETDRYRAFTEDARELVADGEGVADREMRAGNFSRDAFVRSSLGNDIGVVELSFTWSGFAAIDGNRVVVGDVFEGGIYIGPDQELVVEPGEGLAFASVDPPATRSNPDSLADSDTVTWSGERQFTDRRPRVVLQPASAVETTSETDGGTADGTGGAPATGTPATGAGEPWSDRLPLLAVLLAVLSLLAGAGLIASRSAGRGLPGPIGNGSSDDGGSGGSNGVAENTSGAASDPGGEADAEAGDGAALDEEIAAGAAAATTEPSVPDEELLSDEDRVVQLLRENGGRMKQHRIVDETGWSKSKVSVLLSEMEEAGTVSKLRVGRENVVSLDGFEPSAAGSPFDEE
ncbi:helix-turn-helix transcriptional regulator [Haloparvum sedimenti]|uniref:helix-turn-helix transcriptional regulator n=1 Tax=Haloparvum sedimenti TaxID=1678448 RepID=UPI00071E8DA8|nr:helix-turn-helix domain-containing protein [Haloparvum sedimenti]